MLVQLGGADLKSSFLASAFCVTVFQVSLELCRHGVACRVSAQEWRDVCLWK